MSTGPGSTSLSEFGFDKVRGPYGTQAVKSATGLELGVPNAGAPILTRGPYGSSVDAHNSHVRSYFVSAGLPSNEVAEVDGHVGGGGGGVVGGPLTDFEPTAYYSVLRRAVNGIIIAGSFAWARINEDDAVVEEGVYWPAIPGSVIDQATALQNRLKDAGTLSSFRSNLPPGPGQVNVRHSGGGWSGAFDVHAVYDIATASGPRYYDADGREVVLADEAQSAVRQIARR